MPQQPNDYALVLGINDYPYYRGLKGAIHDASRFSEWLLDDVIGGGVPKDQIKPIFSKAAEPIKDEVDEALAGLIADATTKGGGRRFYLFFSGHGLADMTSTSPRTALCLGKWSESRRNYALDAECYTNHVVQSQKFSEVVLFADCCRVRKVSARGECPTYGNIAPSPSPDSVRKFTAHATELMDQAFEAAVGSTGEVRGHFSRALMEALWGAAAEPTGGVKALRLKKYLEDEVPRLALGSNHKQQPVIVPSFATADEPVFGSALPVPQVPNLKIVFANPSAGAYELEGPQIDQFQHADASAGVWELSLIVGTYILRRKSDRRETRIRIDSVITPIEVTDAA